MVGLRDFSLLCSTQPSSGVLGTLFLGIKQLGMKLTTHLHLVLRLTTVELYLHFPICLHGMALN
jgi:hypothetical protein